MHTHAALAAAAAVVASTSSSTSSSSTLFADACLCRSRSRATAAERKRISNSADAVPQQTFGPASRCQVSRQTSKSDAACLSVSSHAEASWQSPAARHRLHRNPGTDRTVDSRVKRPDKGRSDFEVTEGWTSRHVIAQQSGPGISLFMRGLVKRKGKDAGTVSTIDHRAQRRRRPSTLLRATPVCLLIS